MTNEQEKQTQPDIGWCPCCNNAVVELPQGYCSACFNHTMTVMSTYEHQLIIDAKDKELAEVRAKLEAAEARIKASQEQEPVAFVQGKSNDTIWYIEPYTGMQLYAQPLIPPDVAELQRDKETSMRLVAKTISENETLKRDNAELRKQLEAKQAQIDRLMLEYCPDEMTYSQVEEWSKHQQHCSTEMEQKINQALSAAPKGE